MTDGHPLHQSILLAVSAITALNPSLIPRNQAQKNGQRRETTPAGLDF